LGSSLNISLFLLILMFSSGNSCQILGNLAKGWRSSKIHIQIRSSWNSSCLRTAFITQVLLNETGRNPWRNLCINHLYTYDLYSPCIMFWMRAYPLRGEVGGGWALEFESFLGPLKWHRADRRLPFGDQKT
jgi:hypothetical protein